jgi:putative transposase
MVIRKRLKIPGSGLAFITTTVANWTPVFNVQPAAIATLRELDKTLTRFHASLCGYVLMPSHVHVLVRLQEISHLSKFVQTFKSISSRRLKEMDIQDSWPSLIMDGKFRLWKPRFDDLLIYSEKQLRIKLEYIHNNPVKAGLVMRSVDWEYSSARDWIEGKSGILRIDKTFLGEVLYG